MLDHSVAVKYAKIPEKIILSMCSEVVFAAAVQWQFDEPKGKSKNEMK